MATVTAGQSATVNIPAGAAWSVTTTGEARVELVAGGVGAGYTSWRVTPDRPLALPPFSSAGTIRIVGVSGTTTDATRSPDALGPADVASVRALVSGAGNVGLRTVLFGHSYFDQETVSGTGVWNAFSAAGTVVWANAMLGHPLQIVAEYALGGYRLLDLMPRYKAEVEAVHAPQVLFVCIGHNDLKGLYPSGGAGQPVPQQPADARQVELPYLLARWDQFLRDDVSPATTVFVLGENPPGRNGLGVQSATTTPQLAVRYLQYNEGLRRLCARYTNVVYCPVERATIDPTSALATNKLGLTSDTDQVHPNIVGAFERARAIAPYLTRLLPRHVDPLPFSAADTMANSAVNSTSVVTSDGATLTVPVANLNAGIRRFVVGDKVVLQPTNVADVGFACRGTVLAASDTAVTVQVGAQAVVSGSSAAAMRISNSRQLLINPLFITTAGGGAGNSGNVGTITGTLPLGVNINSVPAGWTVTVSTEPHTLEDGASGYGNWLKLVISNASGAAGTFQVIFPAHSRDNTPVSYDVWRKAFLGETYQAGIEVRQVDATGGWNGYSLTCPIQNMDAANEATVDGPQPNFQWLYRDPTTNPNTSAAKFPLADHRVIGVTPEMYLPPVAGKRLYTLQPRLNVFCYANGGATLYLGRVGLWAVDDPAQRERVSLQVG